MRGTWGSLPRTLSPRESESTSARRPRQKLARYLFRCVGAEESCGCVQNETRSRLHCGRHCSKVVTAPGQERVYVSQGGDPTVPFTFLSYYPAFIAGMRLFHFIFLSPEVSQNHFFFFILFNLIFLIIATPWSFIIFFLLFIIYCRIRSIG